jgi:hypothetical protein
MDSRTKSMSGMLPLTIRPSPSFALVATLGLPALVETAGWVVPFDDEFRVWVNRPGEGITLQLRVSASHEIHELPPLPIVAAGAVRCEQEFVVTGADSNGRPIVLGSGVDGSVLWQHELDAPHVARWPVPGCVPQPVIIWQTDDGQVEVADVRPSGVVRRTPFAAGGPPIDLAAAGNSVWALWSDELGVWAIEAGAAGSRKSQVAPGYASQLSVGSCNNGICIAWGREQSFLTRRASGDADFDAPVRLGDAGISGGMLEVIPGGDPLVHVRGTQIGEDDIPQPKSVLTGPGLMPLVIEGLVHSIACRNDALVVLGSTELRFLKRLI